MKILVDEQMPEGAVESLRRKNHSVKRVRAGNSDQNILTQAKDGDRTLVTIDSDFKKLAEKHGAPKKGILLFSGINGMDSDALTKFIVEGVNRNQTPGRKLVEISGTKGSSNSPIPNAKKTATGGEAQMADRIIRTLPLGRFKSTTCKPIIAEHFSNHPIAKLSDAQFGTEFQKTVWPHLKKRGVKQAGQSPIRYEMTQAAQNSLK